MRQVRFQRLLTIMVLFVGGCYGSGIPTAETRIVLNNPNGTTMPENTPFILVREFWDSGLILWTVGQCGGPAGGHQDQLVEVLVSRVSSGDTVRQQGRTNYWFPLILNLGLSARQDYLYYLFSRGCERAWLQVDYARGELTGEIVPLRDRQDRGRIVEDLEHTLKNDIPRLRRDDPLRKELLEILDEQARIVISSPPVTPPGFVPVHDRALACQTAIRKAQAQQK